MMSSNESNQHTATTPADNSRHGDKKDRESDREKSLEEGDSPDGINLEDMTFPEGGARAWAVAFGAAGVLFCTLGYANTFGVYQEYYQVHQLRDRTPSEISWIGSLQTVFVLGGALFGGPLFDRFGSKVIWPAAAAYVFSVMITSICTAYYQFILAQGILGGIAAGMTMSPAMAATGQYFNKKRAAALGMAVAGSSLGGVVFPIALAKMLYNPRVGFAWTVRICGFLMLGLLAPSCLGIRARLPPRKNSFFLPSAFKEGPYVVIITASFLMMLGFFVPFFYLPVYAVEHGMDSTLASYLISVLNGASFFGRIIPGILADRLGRLNMLCAAAISTAILIFCWPKTSSNASIIVFSALYGFCSGAIISLMAACLTQIPKDPRNIGTYMGMGMAVVSLATLIGPPINGALINRYSTYDQAAIFSGVLVLVGGVIVFFAKHVSGKGVSAKV